jgi:putative transposase
VSVARPVFPGAVNFSTRRVHKRHLLLRPSKRVNQTILYSVAVLGERHGLRLHSLCGMSNHMHHVATDQRGNAPDFDRDCHAIIARQLNAMHGDFESVWAREPTWRMRCEQPSDVLDKIVDTLVNPVETHLVAHGRSWPGVRRSWLNKPLKIRRPPGFLRSVDGGGNWPDEVTLRFERPPGFDHLSDEELADLIRERVAVCEAKIREDAAKASKRFLGRRAVLAQSRYAYPSSSASRCTFLRPTVTARSRWARLETLMSDRQWLGEYEAAREHLRCGQLAVFPPGTYKLRVYYNLACRPPPNVDAGVTTRRDLAPRSRRAASDMCQPI